MAGKTQMIEGIDPGVLKEMYLTMLRIRRFEEMSIPLINNEIKCPVHLYVGQEGVATGVCANLNKRDFVFSTHRSHGHYLAKGGDAKALMAEMYGKASGCSRGRGGSMHLTSPDMGLLGSPAIVAGSIPLACGTALASKMNKSDAVTVSFFGDGATSEGVFYEALNFAALKKLPVIFVCENNLYATHLQVNSFLSDSHIYRKARAFAMHGSRVNGNNVMKVYLAAKEAVERARKGDGPSLLEFMTYRWYGHVGTNRDIGVKLRSQKELDSWMAKCPINLLEQTLLGQGILTEVEKKDIAKGIEREIQTAITFARESDYPDSDELPRYVFDEGGR
jgi:acetoin:2,6-dichlorophenolindophenol oxidoreductase subunit alpha